MKKILFCLLFVCPLLTFAAGTKKVAILETVDKENKLSYATKLMVRSSISKAITQAEGYEAYDRSDMDAIMGEQNFQRTGMVSSDQIKRLGEMTGANYVVVVEAVKIDDSQLFLAAKILNVETALTDRSDNILLTGISVEDINEGCEELACKLLGLPYTPKKITKYATSSARSSESNAAESTRKSSVQKSVEEQAQQQEETKVVSVQKMATSYSSEGKTLVFIRRPFQMQGSGLHHYIVVNDVYLGDIKTGKFWIIRVNPGNIIIKDFAGMSSYEKLKDKSAQALFVTGEADQTVYIKLDESFLQHKIEDASKADKYESPEFLKDVETGEVLVFN